MISLSGIVRWSALTVLVFLGECSRWTASSASAQAVPSLPVPSQLDLTVPADQLDRAKQNVRTALARLQTELATQAIGADLAHDFYLSALEEQLRESLPDVNRCAEIESNLRRLLPGRVQQPVDDLRHALASWRRLVHLQQEGPTEMLNALEMFNRHLADSTLRQSMAGQIELSNAYAVLVDTRAFADDYVAIRKSVSHPNFSVLVKRDYLESVAHRQFQVPVHHESSTQGTHLKAQGVFHIATSLQLPVSSGESRLLVHATGQGEIDITAARQRICLSAQASPVVSGAQILHLYPRSIAGDPVSLEARVQAQLAGLNVSGHLGKIQLVQRLVSRIASQQLDQNEPKLSEEFETTLRSKVDEIGYELAYRINGLLRHGIWDRLQSIEYLPDVALHNSSQGIHSDTTYAYDDQLGALTTPPKVAASEEATLDMLFWLHESAVNNVMAKLRGLRLDEATMRGMWQVQLKLTSPEWDVPSPARIPAAIYLARHQPVTLRLQPGGVQFHLRLEKCELDGVQPAVGPCEYVIEYRLEGTEQQPQLLRSQLRPLRALPAEEELVWTQVLERFWGKSIRPLHRFQNSSFREWMRLAHLEIVDGWLVVGCRRVAPEPTAESRAVSEVVP